MGKVNRFVENKQHLMIVQIPFSPQNKKRPNGRFGGEKGCSGVKINILLVCCSVSNRSALLNSLTKNSPPDCFYLALLGTLAFESPFLRKIKNALTGVLAERRGFEPLVR